MKIVEVGSREEWRAWLAENHDKESAVWLLYFKKGSGRSGIEYGASVEDALCYGWVDSIIKKIDEASYVRKFTPRKDDSNWSPSNKKRVAKMINEGLMTDAGMQKVDAAKRLGRWDSPNERPDLSFKMPAEFEVALSNNKDALKTFENLAPTYKKQYLGWIEMAKRPETKAKRINESIRLLADGKKLGLK